MINIQNINYIHIEWEGPFLYEEVSRLDKEHDYGIYQIYGCHPIYGSDVLLYIGKAQNQTFAKRLSQEGWGQWNRDASRVEAYVGRLSGSETPEDWDNQINLVEKLLIYAHGPAANTSNLNSIPDESANLHVLNWGQFRDLMAEVSGARWSSLFDDIPNWAAYGQHGIQKLDR